MKPPVDYQRERALAEILFYRPSWSRESVLETAKRVGVPGTDGLFVILDALRDVAKFDAVITVKE